MLPLYKGKSPTHLLSLCVVLVLVVRVKATGEGVYLWPGP